MILAIKVVIGWVMVHILDREVKKGGFKMPDNVSGQYGGGLYAGFVLTTVFL